MSHLHQSVLLTEAVEALALAPDDVVVDATVGGAGHFNALLSKLSHEGTLIGIDADTWGIQEGKKASMGASARVELILGNFRNLGTYLDGRGIASIDKALFDLGWSSQTLASGRGFSFQVDEPLIMTYAADGSGTTAAEVINSASEEALADMLFTLGEERFARGIARSIVKRRSQKKILTTNDLVLAVLGGTPSWYQHRKIHPATKTFQALRMFVNDELGALREGLSAALARLTEGGRIAVITFHSIEDRVVKSMFKEALHEGRGFLVTKKPFVPSVWEVKDNPRSRSAKLRVFEAASSRSLESPLTSSYVYAS